MKSKTPLSVAIITKNEEKKLPACLNSVDFADDIVVVDSESTDNTANIARDSDCRVFVEDWKGFGPQKNSAVSKCKHDWVLIIDADERIPEESKKEIIKIIKNPDSADGYSFPLKNFFHGRWLRYADFWPDRHLRLVKKSKGSFRSKIHERWITDARVEHLSVPIEHYSFDNYYDMLRTLNEYSTATSIELFSAGARANFFTPIFHSIGMFLKIYFLKRGFLIGFDGLVIALTKSGGAFFKYAKLRELQMTQSKK